MANLDPQVQIKLIDISKEWAVLAAGSSTRADSVQRVFPNRFDAIYKRLVKTVSESEK